MICDDASAGWVNGQAKTTYGQGYQNACLSIATAIRALKGTAR